MGRNYFDMRKVYFLILLWSVGAARADVGAPFTDADANSITIEINDDKNAPDTHPVAAMPRVTVDTDSPLDMNWGGMLTQNGDGGGTPQQEKIALPQWRGHQYTIDNLQIKLRVVDVWF